MMLVGTMELDLFGAPWAIVVALMVGDRFRGERQTVVLTLPVLLSIVVGYLASSVAFSAAPDDVIPKDFYAQVSQVLPVLLLALSIEDRLVVGSRRTGAQRSLAALTLMVLLAGEGLALAVLAVGHDFAFAFGFVVQAVVLGFATIVALAVTSKEPGVARRSVPVREDGSRITTAAEDVARVVRSNDV